MSHKSVNEENVSKPAFCKSLSPGENWKSKSMRIIPEEFERSIPGAFEHRVVFSVRWENSWQLWLQREKKVLVMEEEDWDEFVDDNSLGPNDILVFTHEDTMFFEVRIIKKGEKEIISAPLEVEPETEPLLPKPHDSHRETTTASASVSANGGTNGQASQGCDRVVRNPERYLLNPESPYFVRTLTKRNDVLYLNRALIEKYDLKFGPVNSAMTYILPEGKEVGYTKMYSGNRCFNGWAGLCRRLNLKPGDSVVCELERSGGLVTTVRVHVGNE